MIKETTLADRPQFFRGPLPVFPFEVFQHYNERAHALLRQVEAWNNLVLTVNHSLFRWAYLSAWHLPETPSQTARLLYGQALTALLKVRDGDAAVATKVVHDIQEYLDAFLQRDIMEIGAADSTAKAVVDLEVMMNPRLVARYVLGSSVYLIEGEDDRVEMLLPF